MHYRFISNCAYTVYGAFSTTQMRSLFFCLLNKCDLDQTITTSKKKKEEKEKKKVKQLKYFPQEFFLNHQPTDIREKNAHHIWPPNNKDGKEEDLLGRKNVGNHFKLQIFLHGASKSQAENSLWDDMSWLYSSNKCPQASTLHLQCYCQAEVIQLCPSMFLFVYP